MESPILRALFDFYRDLTSRNKYGLGSSGLGSTALVSAGLGSTGIDSSGLCLAGLGWVRSEQNRLGPTWLG